MAYKWNTPLFYSPLNSWKCEVEWRGEKKRMQTLLKWEHNTFHVRLSAQTALAYFIDWLAWAIVYYCLLNFPIVFVMWATALLFVGGSVCISFALHCIAWNWFSLDFASAFAFALHCFCPAYQIYYLIHTRSINCTRV